ncbi:MAG: DUF2520 domain-containing protein [Acidobacteria bacterium]|nr:DUF2520 domain-containing protein [Acidobacteriota bacterium]MBV9071674.1 DUF2520 domain-containing protein [Acidobacteriota bacterium]MBV9184341.1 DUF2520 domain-containing protein [Acidobacteriota bacterium]
MKLGIIGGGRAAWAFASTWKRIGWPINGIARRGAEWDLEKLAATSEIILVAVSDRAIEEVAAAIPETTAIIIHPSGALPALRGGFSLHPLKSLPPVGEPSDLEGTLLVFEGAHRDIAEQIAVTAGARFAEISAEEKIRYHAGAVFGSNYIAALLDIAEELIGMDGARDDIAVLARSAIDNWAAHTDARRFTGPASRGDDAVMQQHRGALRDSPELAEIYRLLAARIVAAAK